MQHYKRPGTRRRAVSKAPPDWPDDLPAPRTDDPPDLIPGADIGAVTLDWYGQRYSIPLRVPGTVNGRRSRPRSDHVAAQIGGEWLVMSLRAALLALGDMAPRVMTRKERAY